LLLKEKRITIFDSLSMRLGVEKRGMVLGIIYLLAIIAAEVVTNFLNIFGGVASHIVVLTALIIHSSVVNESGNRKLLLALCLAPLTRILSLSMPLAQLPQIYWYIIIYPALFLAAWVVLHRLHFKPTEVGLNFRKLRLQLAVALTGFGFGIGEYIILRPEPMISEFTFGQLLFPVFVFVVGTGFVEEFMFRGVMQRAATSAMGRLGLPYVALVFTTLHLIHHSAIDIIFVFIVALFFGWVVNKTGSLFGVTLSHGIANTVLYLVAPFFF